VLVPVSATGELLFTVRNPQLPSHAGQISFPGGAIEAGESPEAAALREAAEEVALEPGRAAVLGRLPAVLSPYEYHVMPVLAWLPDKPLLRPSPDEVSEVFWAPLAELANTAAWKEPREVAGMKRFVWHYPWRGRDVWGLTANVLHDLLGRVCGGPE
jgi:8-oxo-dGTP pyrophosphatase MutT (NUDIX family)